MLGTRKHRLSGENPTVGVFATRDHGDTWEHMGWKQGKAFAVYTTPTSCGDTVWVAAGNGVHRSIDGGETWRITTPWEVTEVQDVFVSSADPSNVWAATPYGTYESRDFGDTWSKIHLAFASSVRDRHVGVDDAVVIVPRPLFGGPPSLVTPPIRSIRADPVDGREAWATKGAGVLIEPGEIPWDGGPTIYEVEFHPSLQGVLYAGGWDTGLLVTRDGGETWDEVTSLATRNIHGIAISRRDPNVIIVGSMDEGVFVTKDGGQTWTASAPELFDQGQIWDVHIAGEK